MNFMSDEPSLEFVDTNILVYAHDISAVEKQVVAKALLQRLWESGNGCISIQILQEFYVNVTRKVAQPLLSHEASEIIRDLSFWQVHSPCANDVLGAIDIQQHYHLSFWDAMMIQSAESSGCSMIWSEDLSSGQLYRNVEVRNPFLPVS
jgi:predicted nucleic acid-binding protein